MMTVRHFDKDGKERIFEVESVEREPGGPVTFLRKEGIDNGKVYIMNSAGETIAKYDLTATTKK